MNHGSIKRRHALCCGAAAVGGLFTSLVDAAASDASPRRAVPAATRALIDATLQALREHNPLLF